MMIRQMAVERVLADALEARGVQVERGVHFVGACASADGVRAAIDGPGGTEQVECRFLGGCDGQASTVRDSAGIGSRGAPYREQVVLADVELSGDLSPDGVHVVPGRAGLVFLFALGEGATWRLLATRPSAVEDQRFGQPGAPVALRDLQAILDTAAVPSRIREVAWSAEVPLQHRVADRFRAGPVFLVGDAAHAHSPAAAQGMNTGIVDAVNLGWKLAFASRSTDAETLLDSYELERRPVARQVLALTHAVYFAEASTHPLPAFARARVLPVLAPAVPLLVRQRLLMAAVVRMLSQGWVRYRRSPLSLDESARWRCGPRAGDRLPDQDVTCTGRRMRLHELTARPGIHVLLSRDTPSVDGLAGGQVWVHRITSWPGRGLLAARPDGHVGLRSAGPGLDGPRRWLRLVGALG
jgi:2-polyprenyl-6-methoxyphenol hydroxylase-like FAD-dependent oxidoreductase